MGLDIPWSSHALIIRGEVNTHILSSDNVQLSEVSPINESTQPLTKVNQRSTTMTTQLIPITTSTLSQAGAVDEVLQEDTLELMRGSLAPATWRAYKADRVALVDWCRSHGVEALPATPATVANYVGSMSAVLAPATVLRRVAMWSWWHESVNVENNPCRSSEVRKAIRGLRRTESRQSVASPLTAAELGLILESTKGDSLVNLRDRALITVGLALGCRRSELVALNVEDLTEVDQGPSGVAVLIRRSKTDQEGHGHEAWLPRTGRATCPVAALNEWLKVAKITEGPLFRSVTRHGVVGVRLSDRSVSTIVEVAATRAGLPPGRWSGHSLRAGFVTDHARRGAETRTIARQTGHSPTSPVIHRYVRDLRPWQDNAAATGDWL